MDPQYLDPRVAPANDAQVEAVRRLLGLAGGTLALGAGARGVVGLGNFLHRNLVGPPRTPQRQSFVRIPVPVEVDDEQPEKMASHDKLADAAQEFASGMGLLRKPGEAVGWLRDNLGGWGQGDLKQRRSVRGLEADRLPARQDPLHRTGERAGHRPPRLRACSSLSLQDRFGSDGTGPAG
jgi:hypothetical protein